MPTCLSVRPGLFEHLFATLRAWPGTRRSCTRTSTRSTRRSSSCSTRACWGGRSRSGRRGACSRRRTRPRRSGSPRGWRGGGPGSCARASRSSAGTSRSTSASVTRRSTCCTTSRRRSSASRSTRRSSTSPGRRICSARPRRSRARSAAGCGRSSVSRSRSAPRRPSTWPRSRRRSPSPTGWSSSSRDASGSSSSRCRSGCCGASGRHAGARLAEAGIRTIGELAATSPRRCERLLGTAAGRSSARWRSTWTRAGSAGTERAESVGAQSAIGSHGPTPQLVTRGARVPRRPGRGSLRAKDRAGRTVTVRVRFTGMRSVTRSLTLPGPVVGHAHAHRGGRAAGLQAIRPTMPTARDHAAGDLGLQPHRAACDPAGAAGAAGRPAPSRLGDRLGPLGAGPARWTRSATGSAARRSATCRPGLRSARRPRRVPRARRARLSMMAGCPTEEPART